MSKSNSSVFRSRFSERRAVKLTNFGPSRTKGSFKDETDINKIVAKYNRTGQLPDLMRSDPQYGDFSTAPDFMDALNIVARAEAQFSALPAAVRAECDNDPSKFLQRVNNDPEWVYKHRLAIPSDAASLEPTKGAQEPPKGGAATQTGGSSSDSQK